jgi:predicted nucleic acid-binding protein
MNDKFFLDTNVVFYSFDESSPHKSEKANFLLRDGVVTGKGAISYQVIQEFFNVAFKRSQGPMGLDEAERFLATVLRPLCTVHSSAALFHKALQLVDRFHMQWYDGLIVAAALEAKCGILYSEDFQSGQKFEGLEVRNPFLQMRMR